MQRKMNQASNYSQLNQGLNFFYKYESLGYLVLVNGHADEKIKNACFEVIQGHCQR